MVHAVWKLPTVGHDYHVLVEKVLSDLVPVVNIVVDVL